jgi:DNA-binding transcriptional LysR family regulator
MTFSPINLRQIRHFVTLVRLQSYVRAAEELGLTQPALSRSLQALEERYGVKLLDRDRAGARLTPAGQQVFAEAEALLFQADELARKLAAPEDGSRGAVAFGFAPHAAPVLLPSLMPGLMRDCPDLTVGIEVQNIQALTGLLARREIEFAVCAEDHVPADAVVDTIPLREISFAMLARPGHPLAAREGVTMDMVWEYPVVSGRWSATVEPRSRRARRGPTVGCDDFLTLFAITSRTDAVWPAPSLAWLDEMVQERLVELKVADAEVSKRMRLVVLTAKRRTLTAQARLVIERIRQAAQATSAA